MFITKVIQIVETGIFIDVSNGIRYYTCLHLTKCVPCIGALHIN